MGSMNVQSVVNRIMLNYDHNHDNKIELSQTPMNACLGLYSPDERVSRNALCVLEAPDAHLRPPTGRGDTLFLAAAKGKDYVTPEDLTSIVGQYKDADGNLHSCGFWGWLSNLVHPGSVPAGGLDRFQGAFPKVDISP